MKAAYGRTLCELAASDNRFVYLDADLGNPSGAKTTLGKAFPARFLDCGIQEANMVGVANGLSSVGMIPFAHTFSCFMARKCTDSIFLTGCFARQNVKLIGSDPGVTAEQNGASHAGMEDMGILRNIPNITLVEPCDPVSFAAVLKKCKDTYGMFYIRYNRKPATRIYCEGSDFEFGKGNILRDGSDATIIASGMMVEEALAAAERLTEEGISVRVVDMFTWKPIDAELILRCAQETGAIITAENHNRLTGLGAAVAQIIVQDRAVPMEFVGVDDQFGQVGKLDFQKETYHLTAADICAKVKRAIKRK